ncbi:MAG: bleomycin resistance protein [Henriciella sp.]
MSPALVPELYVSNLRVSVAFYCDTLGFAIDYARPEDRFAFLKRGTAALMLEEPIGRTWLAAPLEAPYGRGINLQIVVEDVRALYAACERTPVRIIQPLETKAYRRRDDTVSQTQFVVQDPDGYLIRLAEIRASEPKETEE